MNTLILVIVLCMAGVAIAVGAAFCLGWFRLAEVPTKTKGHFVLMLKKVQIPEDETKSEK